MYKVIKMKVLLVILSLFTMVDLSTSLEYEEECKKTTCVYNSREWMSIFISLIEDHQDDTNNTTGTININLDSKTDNNNGFEFTQNQKTFIKNEMICGTKITDIIKDYDFRDSYYTPNVIFQYIATLLNFEKTNNCAKKIVIYAFNNIRNELLTNTLIPCNNLSMVSYMEELNSKPIIKQLAKTLLLYNDGDKYGPSRCIY